MDFILPETRQFLDYWFALQKRSGKLLPARADFKPHEIKSILKYIGLAEITDAGELVYRLVGTGIDELMGMALTGRKFGEIIEERTRPVFNAWVEDLVAGHHYGIYFIFTAGTHTGRQVEIEDIALPLGDASGRARFVVGHGPPTRSLAYGDTLKLLHGFRALKPIDLGSGIPESATRLSF